MVVSIPAPRARHDADPSRARRFRGCDLRAVCQTAGATAWASDWAAPGLAAFLLPALGNGAWVILLTLHINGSRRTRGGYEGDHFMVCPPVIATETHVEEIMENLTAALEEFSALVSADRRIA